MWSGSRTGRSPGSRRTGLAPRSTAPSIGSTRRSSTIGTVSAGAPTGKRIAYWQLDASGVRDFLLINNTDSLYSFTIPVQYPKAGTTNSSCRVGVVDADGGKTRWLETPGDPRNTYIARMEWAASSDEVVLQHFNRLQNTLQLMLGDAKSGKVRTILTDQDSAWVDVVDDMRWLDGGKRFTWVSERDGWRHMYTVRGTGATCTS